MEEFSLLKKEILKLRTYGITHCEIVKRTDSDLKKSLLEFRKNLGFSSHGELDEIDRDLAFEICVMILTQDLAYNVKIMHKDKASELTSEFFSFFGKNAKFFTNGTFKKNELKNSIRLSQWLNMTDATFDAGIFAVDDARVGCILVEDED